MTKQTPKYLNPLQGLKDKLIKNLISSLIKLFTNPKSGNKKLLISLLILTYSAFYTLAKHIGMLFDLIGNYVYLIVGVYLWIYFCYKLIISNGKIKKELKDIENESEITEPLNFEEEKAKKLSYDEKIKAMFGKG